MSGTPDKTQAAAAAKAQKKAEARARAAERRRNRARFRDTVASVVFFAAGFYVTIMGVLGIAGQSRGVAPDAAPYMYWFACIVSGCALLAGGLMVLRHQQPLRLAWWLCVIAAAPGCLLWLWGLFDGFIGMFKGDGPSASAEAAALGVLIAFALLGFVGLRRAQAGYVKPPPQKPSA